MLFAQIFFVHCNIFGRRKVLGGHGGPAGISDRGYNLSMAKRFLYLVALAFILQLSWGSASAYCMHEMDKTGQHFGHHQHQHQHQGSDTAGSEKSLQKNAGAHPDCATCAHSPLFITELAWDPSHPLLPIHEAIIPSPEQAAPYLGLPERPQWRRAIRSGARSLMPMVT